jgi:nucleoside-diphosphate-sugar epimerase
LGSRIKEHLEGQGFSVIEPIYLANPGASLTSRTVDIEQTLHQGPISTIISAASPNSAFAESNSYLVHDWANRRSAELVRLAELVPSAQLVHLSTVQVYGEESSGLLDESSPLLGGQPYALMHKSLEAGLVGIERATIFRLGNVYGRPGRGGVISWDLFTHDLARRFTSLGFARIRSNPNLARDFIPSAAVVQSIDGILRAESFGVFNITTGESKTLRAWAGLILERAEALLERKCELFFDGEDKAINEVRFDNRKIRESQSFTSQPMHQEIQELDELLGYAMAERAEASV